MIPDCTLVTACFNLTKYNPGSRTIDAIISSVASLLHVPCYMVVYTDETLVDRMKEIRERYAKLTKFIVCTIEDLPRFELVEQIRKNREAYFPTKDARVCPESHFICCSKFQFVLDVIRDDPFKTAKFGWIDSNVGPEFAKISTNYKNHMLLSALANSTEQFHIQIMNVCDKTFIDRAHLKEYYAKYRWVVCGCFFTTGKAVGLDILSDLNREFVDTTAAGYGHGEEMLYLPILEKYYDKIVRTYGDYHHILNNFVKTTEGLHYIYWYIVNKYYTMGYYRECRDCCSKLIADLETFPCETIRDHYVFYEKYAQKKMEAEIAILGQKMGLVKQII